jgi:hypothetical protein
LAHRRLVRLGLQRAREAGAHLGRPFLMPNATLAEWLPELSLRRAARALGVSVNAVQQGRRRAARGEVVQTRPTPERGETVADRAARWRAERPWLPLELDEEGEDTDG